MLEIQDLDVIDLSNDDTMPGHTTSKSGSGNFDVTVLNSLSPPRHSEAATTSAKVTHFSPRRQLRNIPNAWVNGLQKHDSF